MAEPKGGPVKPPTLDLKPTRSNAAKPASAKPGSTKPSAPKTAAQKSSASKPDAAKTNTIKTHPDNKPAAPDLNQTKASGATSAATHTAQDKSAQDQGAKSGSSPNKPSLSPYIIAGIGAIGGAFLALIILAPLLLTGLLQPASQQNLNPRINALTDRVGISEEQVREGLVGVSIMNEQIIVLRQSLEDQNQQLQSQIEQIGELQTSLKSAQDALFINQTSLSDQSTTLSQTQNALRSEFENLQTQAAQITFDPTPLSEQIASLGARIDAIAAGASTEDAAKLSADLSQLQTDLARMETSFNSQSLDLDSQISSLGTRLFALENQSTIEFNDIHASIEDNRAISFSLQERLETQELALQSLPPIQQNAALQLLPTPLALMEIEAALNSGQPFLLELQSLQSILPDTIIPASLTQYATTGLPRSQEVILHFNQAIPGMLAARPTNPQASWTQRVGNTIQSLLAIRPTNRPSDDPVLELVRQTEISVNQHDFTNASALIGQLPLPMQSALGDVAGQIQAMGTLNLLLNEIRDITLAQDSQGLQESAVSTSDQDSAEVLNRNDNDESAPDETVPNEAIQ